MNVAEMQKPEELTTIKPYMISTSDNPFNPWTNFHEWYVWDETYGYHTCSRLARLCDYTDDLGDSEELQGYYDACEKLLMYNVPGNYIKVFEPDQH